MSVIVTVRERIERGRSVALYLWAVVMAVVLFVVELGGSGARTASWLGAAATALLGVYLGWTRRFPTVFVAPLVSWLVAAVPLLVASMIHHGPFSGIWIGLATVTIGWIGIGGAEFLWLALVAGAVRLMRGPGPGVSTIIGPPPRP